MNFIIEDDRVKKLIKFEEDVIKSFGKLSIPASR